MDRLIEYKGITFGYDNNGTIKAIIATQDGVSKISYGNSNFTGADRILKFIIFEGYLHAIKTDDSSACTILRLDKVNTLAEDTWNSDFSTNSYYIQGAEYFDDYIYLFTKSGSADIVVYQYQSGTPTLVVNPLFTNFKNVYDTLYFKDKIYVFGQNSTPAEELLEYDGATTTTSIMTQGISTPKWPGSYQPVGKKLLAEYKGKLYFMDHSGTEKLRSYDIDTQLLKDEFTINGNIVTTMKVYNGMILLGAFDYTLGKTDVKVFVVDEFIEESDLIAGEGDVYTGLVKVKSDPIFLIKDPSENRVNNFSQYPILMNLKGKLNPIIKYGTRIEYYTDLNDVSDIVNINLKDMMDQLASLTDNFFRVDAENIAIVKRRDMVGVSDSFMTMRNNNDYGNNYIQDIQFSDQKPINFRRIVVSWCNSKWDNNDPVASGSIATQHFATFEFDSIFVNNPVLAKNIGMFMLNKLSAAENLGAVLSFAYFLDGGENLVFDVDEDYIYVDDDKEWKLNKVIHDIQNKITRLELVERNIIRETLSI